MPRSNRRWMSAASALVALGAHAAADEAPRPPESPVQPPAQGEVHPPLDEDARFNAAIELRYASAYFADGYRAGDDGLHIQPLVALSYEALSHDGVSITPYAFAWANITDEQYEGGDSFDEVNVGAGLELTIGRWMLAGEYVYCLSPVDNFDDTHEIGLSVGFDDEGLTRLPVTLNPFVSVYHEAINTGGQETTRGVIGLEPTIELEQARLTLSAPIQLGLGLNDYYFDEDGNEQTLGYLSVGLAAEFRLNDRWYLTAGVEYLHLLDDATKEANSGDGDAWVGGFAVGFDF